MHSFVSTAILFCLICQFTVQVARQLAEAYLPRLGISTATTDQGANAKQKKPVVKKKQTPMQSQFADFKVS